MTLASCEDIYLNNPETGDKSGYYRISIDQWTYCNKTAISTGDFIPTCAGGWRRVAHIDVEAGDKFPTGWTKATIAKISVEHQLTKLVVLQHHSPQTELVAKMFVVKLEIIRREDHLHLLQHQE